MARTTNRRDFLRDLGIGAAAVAVRAEPAEPRASPAEAGGSSGWWSCSAPTASIPPTLLAGRGRRELHAQGDPRAARAVPGPDADPARRLRQGPRRRRQPHARHRLPADRHRAVPRQHPGRLRHAGRLGRAACRSTRRSRTTCRPTPGDPDPVRLAGVRRDGPRPGRHLDPHGLRRPEQADRADRRSVPDVRQALRPDEGPREPQERPRRPAGGPQEGRARPSAPRTAGCSRSTPRSSARWSRSCSSRPRPTLGHAVPELEPGVKEENDNMPQISKMQIDLMVNSFAADFARVATLAVHQLGRQRPDALARRRRGAPRAVARAGQQRGRRSRS